jgi:uncharacterized protein YdeI (YjbR/CyaY-like superfamily)
MDPRVDVFLKNEKKWRGEFTLLREIALGVKDLEEGLKWGVPCYSRQGKNVALIHGFKEYCALLFVKGALLKDPKGILVQQTDNVQAARQIRLTSTAEIIKLKAAIKAYLLEAIEIEKSGLKVELKATEEFTMPKEFKARLDSDPALKRAFLALTPGRQRAYLLHFSGAKQAQTREDRVEKCAPRILEGLGLND